MKKLLPGLSFCLFVTAATAPAALVVTTSSQTNGSNTLAHTYSVSSTDLLNGLTATSVAGNFTQEGTGGVGVLTDGQFASPITRDTGGPFQFASFATDRKSTRLNSSHSSPSRMPSSA